MCPEITLVTSPEAQDSVGLQLAEDFVVLGELAGLMLRVDESAIDLHIENPAAAFDEFGINPGSCFDCVRQTGGFGRVVSLNAVGNADLHVGLLRLMTRNETTQGTLIGANLR